MKLRNKKTGEIMETGDSFLHMGGRYLYNSLAELNEEWEDYEEPKEWWYIDIHGPHKVTNNDEYYQQVKAASKEFGNYFDTREEAELAVRKLKAWKRLKDKGYKLGMDLSGVYGTTMVYGIKITASEYNEVDDETRADLDLLFGGEE